MKDELTFGSFMREKRLESDPHISLRKFAELVDISAVYMSNIENDRIVAPPKNILEKFAEILNFDKQEQNQMYDLAAKSKPHTAVPDDLPEYITSSEYACVALRMARDMDATDEEWIEFMDKLKKRGKEGK